MKEVKRVEVQWVDSISSGSWHDYDKEDVDMSCTSVGMLIENSKDRMVLALNQSAYGFGHYITIPKTAVRRVRKLKA